VAQWIEPAVEHRDHDLARGFLHEDVIRSLHHLRRRLRAAIEAAGDELDGRDEHRGGDAMAGDIRELEGDDPVLRILLHAPVVATDLEGGKDATGDVVATDVGNTLRQEALLDPFRHP